MHIDQMALLTFQVNCGVTQIAVPRSSLISNPSSQHHKFLNINYDSTRVRKTSAKAVHQRRIVKVNHKAL